MKRNPAPTLKRKRSVRRKASTKKPSIRKVQRAPTKTLPVGEENREEWLKAAVALLRPKVQKAAYDAEVPAPKRPFPMISVGYPGGRSTAEPSWSFRDDRKKQSVIYISPKIGQGYREKEAPYDVSVRVLDLLLHELIHDAIGHELGHGEDFQFISELLGLEGYSHSVAGEDLREELRKLVKEHLGPYPHRSITIEKMKGYAKQKNRQRKYVCNKCGQIIRCAGEGLKAQHLCEGRKTPGVFKLAKPNEKPAKKKTTKKTK